MQVRLSQILSSLESGGRPKGGASLDNNGIPSLGAEHLDGNGGFNFKTVKYIPEEYFNGLKNGIIEKENILIVKDGATTGKVSFVTDEFPFDKAAVNEHVFLLKVDKSKAHPKFVFHYLKSPQGQRDIMRDFRGATVGGISRGFVDFVKFELPPLPDQLHIANLLSKAENLIAQRKESIRLLDEFLKSTFLEMFGDPVRNEKGWEMLSGNDYLSKLTVGVVIKPASYYVSEGVIALRSLNIRPNRIQLDNLVYFSKSVNEKELSKSILREGDVVFVRTGMTGTAAIIPKELDGCNCIDLIVTRPKSGVINPQYLVFFFNSDIGKRIVSAKEVGGIQKHFNIGALRKLEIPVPPIVLQTQFAHIVEKTEALKIQYQQSLQELENLYGSLSQKAFRGELELKKASTV